MGHKIKESIDKTIGQKDLFTQKDKEAIYTKIRQESGHHSNKKVRHSKKLTIIFAYTAVAALLLIIGISALGNQFGISHLADQKSLSAHQNSGNGQSKGDSPYFQDFKSEQAYAKQYPDQFHIVKKMYYSLNYINNAQGNYEYGSPQDGNVERVKFYVNYDKGLVLSKDKSLKNGKLIQTETLLKRNGVVFSQLPEKKIYTEGPMKDDNDGNRFNKKSTEYNKKRDLSSIESFVTNSEWVHMLQKNYKNWTYKEGTKFGIPVYKIEGVDHLKRPFTMTVTKNTGVLLDLKSFNKKDNKVGFYITVKDIQINKGVPNTIFQLDVTGDKKLSWKDFSSKTQEGTAFKGEKNGGVVTSQD